MAHINVNTYKEILDDARRTDTETLNESSEEPLQPSGGDERAVPGESGGSDGTLTEQTNTDNDVAGLGTAETKAKFKSGAK